MTARHPDVPTPASLPPRLRTLANGVTLLAAPMPQLASAAVAVFVRAGSRDESDALAGIGHFLEHMAFKGTASRTVQAINFAAESLGADMNAYTDKDATCFHLEGLGTHVARMLELLADIVLHGTFPAEEIERERAVILQECIEYAEDPEQLSFIGDIDVQGSHALAVRQLAAFHEFMSSRGAGLLVVSGPPSVAKADSLSAAAPAAPHLVVRLRADPSTIRGHIRLRAQGGGACLAGDDLLGADARCQERVAAASLEQQRLLEEGAPKEVTLRSTKPGRVALHYRDTSFSVDVGAHWEPVAGIMPR